MAFAVFSFAGVASVAITAHGPDGSIRGWLIARQIFVCPRCRKLAPSVVSVGPVQVSAIWSPVRVAFRSETGFARFKEGGCGGPGVPHPDAKASTNAGRHSRFAEVARMN